MEVLLLILAGILLLAGVVGSFLPVLPGPPLSWSGILVAHFFTSISYPDTFLWLVSILMLVITILDYVLPGILVRRGKGSRMAVNGANLGVVIGLFLGPLGIVFGPLLGALVGEIIHGTPLNQAFRPALLAFMGFLSGVFIKLVFALVLLIDFFIRLF